MRYSFTGRSPIASRARRVLWLSLRLWWPLSGWRLPAGRWSGDGLFASHGGGDGPAGDGPDAAGADGQDEVECVVGAAFFGVALGWWWRVVAHGLGPPG